MPTQLIAQAPKVKRTSDATKPNLIMDSISHTIGKPASITSSRDAENHFSRSRDSAPGRAFGLPSKGGCARVAAGHRVGTVRPCGAVDSAGSVLGSMSDAIARFCSERVNAATLCGVCVRPRRPASAEAKSRDPVAIPNKPPHLLPRPHTLQPVDSHPHASHPPGRKYTCTMTELVLNGKNFHDTNGGTGGSGSTVAIVFAQQDRRSCCAKLDPTPKKNEGCHP